MRWQGIRRDSLDVGKAADEGLLLVNGRFKIDGELRRRRGMARSNIIKKDNAVKNISGFSAFQSNVMSALVDGSNLQGYQQPAALWGDNPDYTYLVRTFYRFNGLLSDSNFVQFNASPDVAGSQQTHMASDGKLYAFDPTGRYVYRSSNHGVSWTTFDYGTGIGSGVYGVIGYKDGAEVLAIKEFASTPAAYILLSDMSRSTYTAPIIAGAHMFTGYNGELLSAGQDGSNLGRVARYAGNDTWQTTNITNGGTEGTVGSVFRMSNGRYLLGGWEFFAAISWIQYSDDFTSWSAHINETGWTGSAAFFVFAEKAGRVVAVRSGDSSGVTILHSTDGASWTAASVPPGARGYHVTGTTYVDAVGDVFVVPLADGYVLTSADGITWSATNTTLGASLGNFAGSFTW